MLELTIVKTAHGRGESEAKRLLDYIKSCDVFSPEDACITEKKAKEIETFWEKMFALGWSRRRFREVFTDPQRRDAGNAAFIDKQYDYLCRQRTPLWFLERFASEEEASWIEAINEASIDSGYLSLNALLEGRIDLFLIFKNRSILLSDKQCEARDVHIAENIMTAEKYIREQYQRISDKDPLKLVLAIGASHFPEDYLPKTSPEISVKVVPLPTEAKNLGEKCDLALSQRRPPEEVRGLFLAYAATEVFKLSDANVEGLSFEELAENIRKRKYEPRKGIV